MIKSWEICKIEWEEKIWELLSRRKMKSGSSIDSSRLKKGNEDRSTRTKKMMTSKESQEHQEEAKEGQSLEVIKALVLLSLWLLCLLLWWILYPMLLNKIRILHLRRRTRWLVHLRSLFKKKILRLFLRLLLSLYNFLIATIYLEMMKLLSLNLG